MPADEPLVAAAFTTLQHAAEATASSVHGLLTDHGLSASQFAALEALYYQGPLCQKALAAGMQKSSGNLTMVTDNLEKRGLVVRRRSKADRRYLEIALSADGRELFDTVLPLHVQRVTEVMNLLTRAELQHLSTLCHKLRQLLVDSTEADKPTAAYVVTTPTKVFDD